MACSKCKGKLILGSAWITEIEPDEEPFEADEVIDLDPIDCNESIEVYWCPKCERLENAWVDN